MRLWLAISALLFAGIALVDGSGSGSGKEVVFVDVDTTGLSPGWKFVTYRFLADKGAPESIEDLIDGDWDHVDVSTRSEGVVSALDVSGRSNEAWSAPYSVGSATNFVALFTGQLEINVEGKYKFTLESDDGSFLFIDGNEVRGPSSTICERASAGRGAA